MKNYYYKISSLGAADLENYQGLKDITFPHNGSYFGSSHFSRKLREFTTVEELSKISVPRVLEKSSEIVNTRFFIYRNSDQS